MEDTVKSLLESAGMNVKDTMGRFMNNEAMYLKFLNKFLADETMQQLEAACEKGDGKDIFMAAHTLKGIAGNLGMDTLTEILVPMNEAYRGEPDDSYPLDENMEKLRICYEEVCSAIRQAV